MDDGSYEVSCTRRLPRFDKGSGSNYEMDAWALAAITPCRVCGHRLLKAESGYVPGHRICEGCGRRWIVKPCGTDDLVKIRIVIPDTPSGPEWDCHAPLNDSQEAFQQYRQDIITFGGNPEKHFTPWSFRRDLWINEPTKVHWPDRHIVPLATNRLIKVRELDLVNQRESLREELLAILDGQPDELADRVCDAIVGAFRQIVDAATPVS